MIEATHIVARHGDLPVLADVTFGVGPGEVVGLCGANGSGKSTLLSTLAGLHPCAGGRVALAGRDATRLPPERRARLGLGHLAQRPSAFRGLSARDNLRTVLEIAGEPRAAAAADEWLARFALLDLAHRPASRLSGGERRRLEVARALCRRPRWLLLDEPLAGLDADFAPRVATQLRAAAHGGAAVLVAAPEVPDGLCDRVLWLADGRVAGV